MLKRRNRRRTEVELNLAAMLDMAFQLLAFFILTYRPAPLEGDIRLTMPPSQLAVPGTDEGPSAHAIKGIDALIVSVRAEPSGQMASLTVGDVPVATLVGLSQRLSTIFREQNQPFDQLVVEAASDLRYDALMDVIDVCTRQHFANGRKLKRLTFVELPEAIR